MRITKKVAKILHLRQIKVSSLDRNSIPEYAPCKYLIKAGTIPLCKVVTIQGVLVNLLFFRLFHVFLFRKISFLKYRLFVIELCINDPTFS